MRDKTIITELHNMLFPEKGNFESCLKHKSIILLISFFQQKSVSADYHFSPLNGRLGNQILHLGVLQLLHKPFIYKASWLQKHI